MAFAFRLEKVLTVRRLQEEEAQRCHADARSRLGAAEESRARLQQTMDDSHREFDQLKRRDEVTAAALHLFSLHMAGLRRSVEVADDRVQKARAAVEDTEAALLAAHQAREALERLREREASAWRAGQARLEAKQLDDIAVTRHRAREEENHGP